MPEFNFVAHHVRSLNFYFVEITAQSRISSLIGLLNTVAEIRDQSQHLSRMQDICIYACRHVDRTHIWLHACWTQSHFGCTHVEHSHRDQISELRQLDRNAVRKTFARNVVKQLYYWNPCHWFLLGLGAKNVSKGCNFAGFLHPLYWFFEVNCLIGLQFLLVHAAD